MNSLTFVMTNMVPQVHELNAGPWEKLEKHERRLAEKPAAELYIAAGPVFDANPKVIGNGVAVPLATYKIICVLSSGQTPADVTPDTEVIAVIIPNDSGVGGRPWAEFRTSVDEVERQTGYDFMPALPDDVESVIEARVATFE
jgi:endonuclease G